MTDLTDIERMASALLAKTAPADRRKLLRTIARYVQKEQRERIARQRDPDGKPFAPRKSSKLRRKGDLRRGAMFRKLRTARYLQAGSSPDEAWVGFAAKVRRIAAIHQYGDSDSPGPGQPAISYPKRRLIGPTRAELEGIADRLLAHLL